MIRTTLEQIRNRIRTAPAIPASESADLLALVDRLEHELDTVPQQHRDEAISVANFMDASTHEATREQRNDDLLNLSLAGVETSVTSFEASHPELVRLVNTLATMLANLGI